jgi:hypothetical protein
VEPVSVVEEELRAVTAGPLIVGAVDVTMEVLVLTH